MTVMEVLTQAKALSREERKELMKLLVDTFDEDDRVSGKKRSDLQGRGTKKHSILEFEGIAKHLADDEDPQDYVNRLRDEWDERL